MSDWQLVLGVDTSRAGSLALARVLSEKETVRVAEEAFGTGNVSSLFFGTLERVLAGADVKMADLAAIVVVAGPGGFTGLRIGLSAVKGLAEAAALPVVAVSSLQVLENCGTPGGVAVAPAGRSEYYARYRENGSPVESLLTRDALLKMAKGRTIIVTDEGATDLGETATVERVEVTAMDAIRTGLSRLLARQFDNIECLDAHYVRQPYTEAAAHSPAIS